MGQIIVVCPSCGSKLKFPETSGFQDKTLICPKCGYKSKVVNYLNGGGVVRKPAVVNVPSGDEEKPTEIGKSPINSLGTIGQIRVLDRDQICQLKIGKNVIGRCAKSGDADIKITEDRYMSRMHIVIEVIQTSSGIRHNLIVHEKCTNLPKHNGKIVNRGDIDELSYGDIIELGHSKIRFEEVDNDATRVALP